MCGVPDDHHPAAGPGRHLTEVVCIVARQLQPPSADQLRCRTSVALDQGEQPAGPLLFGRVTPLFAGDLPLGHIDKPHHPAGVGCAPKNARLPKMKCHASDSRSLAIGVLRVIPPKFVSPTYRAAGACGSITWRTREYTPSAPMIRSALSTVPSVKVASTWSPASVTSVTSAPWRTRMPRCSASRSSRAASQ